MSSKEDDVERVKYELKELRINLNEMDAWKIEIGVLEEKINAYRNGGFGYGIQWNSTITIDDLVDRDETRLNTLKSNVDYTNYKLKEYKAVILCLNDNEYEVINRRYLEIRCNHSYEGIAKDMKFSKSHIKRLHDSAIKKMAKYRAKGIGIPYMVRIGNKEGTNRVRLMC